MPADLYRRRGCGVGPVIWAAAALSSSRSYTGQDCDLQCVDSGPVARIVRETPFSYRPASGRLPRRGAARARLISDNRHYLDFVRSCGVAEGIAQAIDHMPLQFPHIVDFWRHAVNGIRPQQAAH
jgi:hypothetical protein